MKTIIISEIQQKNLIKNIIKESFDFTSEQIKLIKNYLDNNFMRADMTQLNDKGYPDNKEIVVMVDKNKQPIKYMTDVELFYLIQDHFQNINNNAKLRDDFLKKIIIQWYNKEKMLNQGILKI